jgi:hypothetical protein
MQLIHVRRVASFSHLLQVSQVQFERTPERRQNPVLQSVLFAYIFDDWRNRWVVVLWYETTG